MSTDTVEITVEEILRDDSDDGAILVLYEDKEHWIPRSQLFGYEGVQGDQNFPIEVAQWFLEKEGMV